MSVKDLLGLEDCGISDYEIMSKLREALVNGLEEIEFVDIEGKTVKVSLPQMQFDPFMYLDVS